jgi:two-component system response regulator NreC
MKTRVFLADDHAIMREGLRLLIDRQRDMEVIGEAEDGRKAVKQVAKLSPEIVVMDIEMPNLNGIDATRQISGRKKPISVIALSAHTDRRYVTEMLKAGAKGYLLKHTAGDELLNAIRTVKKGKTYLSPEIAETVAEECRRQSTEATLPFAQLSEREREVLQMLAEGKARKEIAADLCVSVKTIATHVENIMEKLNLHSVAELTKYAIRQGLTSVE